MSGRHKIEKPTVRRARIVDYTTRHGGASVDELVIQFETSAETIRRDLAALSKENKIRKVHGGAQPMQLLDEGPFAERMTRNALGKKLIAEMLPEVVVPGQTLMLDTGSTTLACAEALSRIDRLKVITNSTRIAAAVSDGPGQIDVYLLGGLYRRDNSQSIGATAIEQLRHYRADAAVITIGGIDKSGIMDYSHEEAEVAKAMIARSDRLIVVCDQEKFHKRAPFVVCSLNQIHTLITDSPLLPPSLCSSAEEAQINLISGHKRGGKR